MPASPGHYVGQPYNFLCRYPLSDAKIPNYFVHSKLLIMSTLCVKARIEKHKFKRFGKKLAHTV